MSEHEAQALVAKADKKAASLGWFGGNKFEEASELYNKAANTFKLGKRWKEAGDAFMKSAQMQIQLNERDEAAMTYIAASKCYKKGCPEESIMALKSAIEILTDRGRFQSAAGHQKEIAQIYESELIDLDRAIQAYELAADWYAAEEATALANNCLVKVAHFAATLEQYDKAIEKFEQVATASIDNQLTKWSVRDYFLKAGLCHIANGDVIGAQRALNRYIEMDYSFSQEMQCTFLKDILTAVESQDPDFLTQKVKEYDARKHLDNWMTTILLRIKNSLSAEPQLT
ncbi:10147_t:CDS:2 [Paraglomus brasilianum]|uniref:10147_t:CDS:1 n=1 Tax=Paraglomus brasilianum TaxID=144538 RepID=A0A9N9EY00_9GLOM|nr:10147_t:CDS:2 [Paraglomus brasilianum]